MSRLIKMTPEYIEECRADFEKALHLTKLADGKLSFTKTFSNSNCKAVVYFTPTAWAKMVILINEFEKEVAWHGVAHRAVGNEAASEDSKSEYIITDIMVYPQTVSAATVEMDTEKYAEWIMENIGDERFDEICMQGHSHVRMGPNPSSVDLNHQEEILNMLGDDDFYIFMIWNKSFAKNCRIYDMRKNTLFESSDISVAILDEDGSLDAFLKDAKDMVKDCSNKSLSTSTPSASTHADNQWDKKDNKLRTRIGAGWYRVGDDYGPMTDDYDPYNFD